MLNGIRNVEFIKIRKLTMFITAACVLVLISQQLILEISGIYR